MIPFQGTNSLIFGGTLLGSPPDLQWDLRTPNFQPREAAMNRTICPDFHKNAKNTTKTMCQNVSNILWFLHIIHWYSLGISPVPTRTTQSITVRQVTKSRRQSGQVRLTLSLGNIHQQSTGILLMDQKSGVHQLRLVVYPTIYRCHGFRLSGGWLPSLKLTVRTWKWMVGRWSFPFGCFQGWTVSFREGSSFR